MILFAIIIVGIPILLDFLTSSQNMLYSLEQYKLFNVARGSRGVHSILLIYALSTLLLVPAVAGVYFAFKERFKGLMYIATQFAMVGIIALTLSLLMIPSIDWILASYIQNFSVEHQNIFIILLMALNSYIGIYIGDILGLGCILVWFFIISIVMIRVPIFTVVTGIFEFVITLCLAIDIILRYFEINPNIYSNIQVTGLMGLWLFICGINLILLAQMQSRITD